MDYCRLNLQSFQQATINYQIAKSFECCTKTHCAILTGTEAVEV